MAGGNAAITRLIAVHMYKYSYTYAHDSVRATLSHSNLHKCTCCLYTLERFPGQYNPDIDTMSARYVVQIRLQLDAKCTVGQTIVMTFSPRTMPTKQRHVQFP